MLYLFAALALLASFILFRRRTELSLALKGPGVNGSFGIFVLPPFPPLRIRFRIEYRPKKGLVIILNGGREKALKRKKKSSKKPNVLKTIKPISVSVRGAVGIRGYPDISVILAGVLGLLLIEAETAIFGIRPEVSVRPSLSKSVFDLNVEGIFLVYPGKILIEILKSKRSR